MNAPAKQNLAFVKKLFTKLSLPTELLIQLISLLIGPGIISSAIIAYFRLNSSNNKELETQYSFLEPSKTAFVPLLAEPRPSSTTIQPQFISSNSVLPSTQLIDQDVLFITGQRDMPLTVYESPMLRQYAQFQKMKKANTLIDNTNYYVVQKTRWNYQPNHEISNSVIPKQEDVIFLYGRGPVFQLSKEYSDRFEGIDD